MVEEDITRLIAHWKSQGVKPNACKASIADIEAWEAKHKVRLSADLRQYVMRLNGIEGGDQLEFGNDFFSFLSLSRIHPETEEFPEGRANMFVFVDYLISSYWYCAELDNQPKEQTRIFLCGTGDTRDRLIATSLREFFRLYIDRPKALEF